MIRSKCALHHYKAACTLVRHPKIIDICVVSYTDKSEPTVTCFGTENEVYDELNTVDMSSFSDTPSPSQMRLLATARTKGKSIPRDYCSGLRRGVYRLCSLAACKTRRYLSC